jgi:hypothetical protein
MSRIPDTEDATMKPYPLLLLVPLALPSLGVAGPVPQASPAHVWQQSHQTNVPDTYPYTRFTLVGKFLTPSRNVAPNRPALVVDCIPADESPRDRGTFLGGNLVVGTTLKIVYVEPEEIRGLSYYPKVALRYHTDNAKDEHQQWSAGSDRTSASIPKQSLEQLLRARSVAITTYDERGRPVAMQFDMPDSTAVEQTCHVD